MNYSPLSAREIKLIEDVEDRNLTVFSPLEAKKILNTTRENAYRILSRLENKGGILRIERGKYIIKRFYSELDIYEIAPHVTTPSYISLWSALHYHGYTTQVPATVFLMVTGPRKPLELQKRTLQFVKVRSSFFFGYERHGRTVVAEPEKLFVDCLAFPHYAGGFGEIKTAMDSADLDMRKTIDYAIRTGSGTVCSRLGHLLETAGKKFSENKLLKHRSRSYVILDPSAPRRDFGLNEKWKVKVNLEV